MGTTPAIRKHSGSPSPHLAKTGLGGQEEENKEKGKLHEQDSKVEESVSCGEQKRAQPGTEKRKLQMRVQLVS